MMPASVGTAEGRRGTGTGRHCGASCHARLRLAPNCGTPCPCKRPLVSQTKITLIRQRLWPCWTSMPPPAPAKCRRT